MTTAVNILLLVTVFPALCCCIQVKAVLKKCGQSKIVKNATDLTGCHMKIDIDVRLSTTNQNAAAIEYCELEKFFDESISEEIELFYPIIIKIQTQEPALVYPLKFLKLVNNKAYEVFIHKDNTENYPGCRKSTVESLCGFGDKNSQSTNHLKKGFCCKCNINDKENQPYHVRGGQDCSNVKTPAGLDDSYHSSAHCLKFDPVWYRVNELEKPLMQHLVYVNVFVQKTDDKKRTKWTALFDSLQEDLLVGSVENFAITKDRKVSATYLNFEQSTKNPDLDPLDYNNNRLLIPDSNLNQGHSKHVPLQLKGNASDFLLIDRNYVRLDGTVCNRIGVSYEAFVKQHKRCLRPAQSCLYNQPMHFWLQDVARKLQGKKTKYFLGGYAEVVMPPMYKRKSPNGTLSLHLKMVKKLTAASLNIQINADKLFPITQGLGCNIEEVYYTDNGITESLSIRVYNQGLNSEDYLVIVSACNISHHDKQRMSVTTESHKSANLVFKFKAKQRNYTGACTVSVLNQKRNKVAERRIWFIQGRKCICLLNCHCSCEVDKFVCVPLNNHTGLRGVIQSLIFMGSFTGNVDDSLFIFVTIVMVLLIIGMMKAVLSLFSPVTIGQCGLCLFMNSSNLHTYYEKDLQHYSVFYNDEGVPIHPKTKKQVQLLPTWKILLLNLVIGFYLPLIGFHWLIRKLCTKDEEILFEREEIIWKKKLHSPVNSEFALSKGSEKEQDSLKNDLDLSPSSLIKMDRELAIEQYRKQKKDLKKQMKLGSKTEVAPPTCDITPPDSDDEEKTSPKRITRSSQSGGRNDINKLFSTRQTLQKLLKTDPVYCNFEKESKFLQNSGTYFSLGGILHKDGRKYKFELGNYFMQTCENVDGVARPLPHPERILHYMQFSQSLTATGVHLNISTDPRYPCLNALLPL